jgi:phosphopantetheinyl transferase
VELSAVAPFAERTLSPLEKARFDKMGAARRRSSFLAARIALKRLFRQQQEENFQILPREIETVCTDSAKPCCVHQNHPQPFCCSLSHDNRFAVAVLSNGSVGVDVEPVSDKALKSARLYMSEKEQQLMAQSALEPRQAAVRVWSAKEAVSKATGMPLTDAWQRVQLVAIGETESRLSIDEKAPLAVAHASVDDHVITLFQL